MFGKCRLCLEPGDLQQSHLLPKALYRLVGSGTSPSQPDTVMLTAARSKKSSEQAWRHLLCRGCEQCLNNAGERWALRSCYRGIGRFPFRDELRKRQPLDNNPELLAYPVQLEEATQFVHFCLGVVWRASLCDWYYRGHVFPQIELGPYQDPIRKYLAGEGNLPDKLGVTVVLSGLGKPLLGMSLPVSYRADSGRHYRFHIPGVMFEAAIGGPARNVAMAAVFIGSFGDRSAQDSMMHLIGRKVPQGFRFPLIEGTEKAPGR